MRRQYHSVCGRGYRSHGERRDEMGGVIMGEIDWAMRGGYPQQSMHPLQSMQAQFRGACDSVPLTFSRSPLPYGPFRSYNAETWATDGGDVALGHVTNYAQNMDGMVWDLAMLEAHLGESHLSRRRSRWTQRGTSCRREAGGREAGTCLCGGGRGWGERARLWGLGCMRLDLLAYMLEESPGSGSGGTGSLEMGSGVLR